MQGDFLIFKKMRADVSLLVDQFMLDGFATGGAGRLPWTNYFFEVGFVCKQISGSFSASLHRKADAIFLHLFSKSFHGPGCGGPGFFRKQF